MKTSNRSDFAKGASYAASLLALAYFGIAYILPQIELAPAVNRAFERQGKGIIYNALGKSLEDAIQHLDQPNSIEKLRDDEQLAYWNYDPILLQIHFHRNQALRVAYFTEHKPTKALLVDDILNHFSEENSWERTTIEQDGMTKTFIVNTKTKTTLVDQDNGVLLCSYNPIQKPQAPSDHPSPANARATRK